MIKKLFYDLSFSDLAKYIQSIGQPEFRTKQIWQGVYKILWDKQEDFTNLSKPLRDTLFGDFSFSSMSPQEILNSSDQETTKILFNLSDQTGIEAVLMKYDQRRTLCISTQVGCAMGCVFCATGQMGFTRQLSAGEIIEQVLYYAKLLHQTNEKVTNIVFMGMGEPFHNYDATMQAIHTLNNHLGFNLGARRFTVSTVGLVPFIKRFADENNQVNLAISLHASNDAERSALLPINNKYNIQQVIDACKYYIEKTNRRITFEWALISGKNDDEKTARELAGLLKGLLCHVNAIPLNPTGQSVYEPSSKNQTFAFKTILEENGIPCTIRLRRGIDIQAGCGQLAVKHQTK